MALEALPRAARDSSLNKEGMLSSGGGEIRHYEVTGVSNLRFVDEVRI